ncbi:MAG: hypothetical protein EA364_00130 [Balneolaceae bacterium]|nr:MAG: hypothetical protein EA364_00130 [Balneolaceae bacterium]
MKQRLMKYVWLATFILTPALTVLAQPGFAGSALSQHKVTAWEDCNTRESRLNTNTNTDTNTKTNQ